MDMTDFRVVTHRNWVSDLFKPVGGVHDFGLDIDPTIVNDTVWWAPGHWVARAARAGVTLPVTSCGQMWMTKQPENLVQRRITVVRAEDVARVFDEWDADKLQVKLPEVKTDAFPAEVRERKIAISDCGRLQPDQLIQVSDTVPFVNEARFFIANREITAWSWYRLGEYWIGEPDFPTQQHPDQNTVIAFASEIARTAKAPNGYTIDVGTTTTGTPLLIEANASWSSNPYDADITGVYASLAAAHDFDGTQSEWRFNTEQYGTVAPLRAVDEHKEEYS